MKKFFGGGKTFIGAIIVGASAIVGFCGYPDVAKLIGGLGASLGVIGIGHKIEKNTNK